MPVSEWWAIKPPLLLPIDSVSWNPVDNLHLPRLFQAQIRYLLSCWETCNRSKRFKKKKKTGRSEVSNWNILAVEDTLYFQYNWQKLQYYLSEVRWKALCCQVDPGQFLSACGPGFSKTPCRLAHAFVHLCQENYVPLEIPAKCCKLEHVNKAAVSRQHPGEAAVMVLLFLWFQWDSEDTAMASTGWPPGLLAATSKSTLLYHFLFVLYHFSRLWCSMINC